jgi:DNA repair exonuclease SbcCD ATPase subunit
MEPIRLKVKNFYIIADGEIDFTKFSSAVILGKYFDNPNKSNGAGKSTINESICWALFNETRQAKVDDVIRWSANEASVEFEFKFGHNVYRIVRRRSRIAKESAVSLYVKENDKWINDSASTNSETNKKILLLLKIDAKIFLNSVYFKENDISLFATSSPSDRKEIIKSIMKLEIWDEYQKQAKNKLKIIKDGLEIQQRVIAENVNLNLENIKNKKALEEITTTLDDLVKKQYSIQNKLHSLIELKKERNIVYLQGQLDKVNNELEELKNNGRKTQNKQREIDNLTLQNASEIEKIDIVIRQNEEILNDINNKIASLQQQNNNYGELEDTILQKKAIKNKLDLEISGFDNKIILDDDKCKECFTELTADKMPHIELMRKIKKEQTEQELKQINVELYNIEEEYKARRARYDNFNAYISRKELIQIELLRNNTKKENLLSISSSLENDRSLNEVALTSIVNNFKSLKIDKEGIENKISDSKTYNIDDEIFEMSAKNRMLMDEIGVKNIELGSLQKEKEFLANRVAMLEASLIKLEKYNKEKIIYEQLIKYFGKDGIQAIFIESIVDELEQYANEMLSYICNEPTIIKLKTQKKTGESWQETLDIDVIMNGFSQTFESLSSGEKFRVSLALRIGLSEVLVKRAGGEIKLLLLDEIDSPLDAYGLNKMMTTVIQGLEKRFKILVISHNESIKERFSHIINISKTANGSYISQT